METKNSVGISYEKVFTDTIGKHIIDIFKDLEYSQLDIYQFWPNIYDAFFEYSCDNHILCLQGDIRVVIVNSKIENTYKFGQYFLSGLDGKVIQIQKNTIFGIHNIGSDKATILSITNSVDGDVKRHPASIFNWNLRRS